jgi:hypothetical protein
MNNVLRIARQEGHGGVDFGGILVFFNRCAARGAGMVGFLLRLGKAYRGTCIPAESRTHDCRSRNGGARYGLPESKTYKI